MSYVWQRDWPAILKAAGVPYIEEKGWETRGHSAGRYSWSPKFLIWHHDASQKGPSPTVKGWIMNGSKALPPPYAHIWVCLGCKGQHAPGTWHLIAAGHAYHAGLGGPYGGVGKNQMNQHAVGIEVDHTVGESWDTAEKKAQLKSLRWGTAAIFNARGWDLDPGLLFHKTWAPKRKVDIAGLDLATERVKVKDNITKIKKGIKMP